MRRKFDRVYKDKTKKIGDNKNKKVIQPNLNSIKHEQDIFIRTTEPFPEYNPLSEDSPDTLKNLYNKNGTINKGFISRLDENLFQDIYQYVYIPFKTQNGFTYKNKELALNIADSDNLITENDILELSKLIGDTLKFKSESAIAKDKNMSSAITSDQNFQDVRTIAQLAKTIEKYNQLRRLKDIALFSKETRKSNNPKFNGLMKKLNENFESLENKESHLFGVFDEIDIPNFEKESQRAKNSYIGSLRDLLISYVELNQHPTMRDVIKLNIKLNENKPIDEEQLAKIEDALDKEIHDTRGELVVARRTIVQHGDRSLDIINEVNSIHKSMDKLGDLIEDLPIPVEDEVFESNYNMFLEELKNNHQNLLSKTTRTIDFLGTDRTMQRFRDQFNSLIENAEIVSDYKTSPIHNRTIRRVRYNESTDKYEIIVAHRIGDKLELSYNPDKDHLNRNDLSKIYKDAIRENRDLDKMEVEQILSELGGDFSELPLGKKLTKEQKIKIENFIETLKKNGLKGETVVNDYIKGKVDIDTAIDITKYDSVIKILNDLRLVYQQEINSTIDKTKTQVQTRYRFDDLNNFATYDWLAITPEGKDPLDYMRRKFDYRNNVTKNDRMNTIIDYGKRIGLFRVLAYDNNGNPSRILVKSKTPFSYPPKKEGKLSELRFDHIEDRTILARFINLALGVESTSQISFESKDIKKYQRNAVREKMDEWTYEDMLLFSNFFEFPLHNNINAIKQRQQILDSLDPKFFEDVIDNNVGIAQYYNELFNLKDEGELNTKIRGSLINIGKSLDANLEKLHEDHINAIEKGEIEKAQEIATSINKSLADSRLNENQIKFRGDIVDVEAKAWFKKVILDSKLRDQIVTDAMIDRWWKRRNFPEVAQELFRGKDKIVRPTKVSSLTKEVKDFIETNYAEQTINQDSKVEELLTELMKTTQKDVEIRRQSLGQLDMELAKEVFTQILLRENVDEQFGFNLVEEIDKQKTFEDTLFETASSLEEKQFQQTEIDRAFATNLFGIDPKITSEIDMSASEIRAVDKMPELEELLKQKRERGKPAPKLIQGIDSSEIKKFKTEFEKEKKDPIPEIAKQEIELQKIEKSKISPAKKVELLKKQERVIDKLNERQTLVQTLEDLNDALGTGSNELTEVFKDAKVTTREKDFLRKLDNRSKQLNNSVKIISALSDIDPKEETKVDEQLFKREYVRANKLINDQLNEVNDVLPQDRIVASDFERVGISDEDFLTGPELRKRGATPTKIKNFEKNYPNLHMDDLFGFMRSLLLTRNTINEIATEVIPREEPKIKRGGIKPIEFKTTKRKTGKKSKKK